MYNRMATILFVFVILYVLIKRFGTICVYSFNMLKRKSEGGGDESPAKKTQTGIASEAKTDPIPRHLPLQSITLNFSQLTWEEVAPGQLYYLPICQNPKYMFDAAMTKQFLKFKELWGTMEIHTPSIRLSNLTMLQDDLRVQNNTPTDATAFTQVLYLIKYCPKGLKQFFKLGNLEKDDMTQVKDLTYTLAPPKQETSDPTQLITLTGYNDFEKLTIQGAKANLRAGFTPRASPNFDKDNNYRLQDAYIAPDTISTLFQEFSGNMAPAEGNFIEPSYSLTMARNLDEKKFFKYGEDIEFDINTNLEGVHLMNELSNNFLEEQLVEVLVDNVTYTYEGEFCWPSRNRPFLSRKNYLDPSTDPIIHGKDFKPLTHCFFSMPPIKKPNKALLGQRCSFILEQKMSITLHMTQGTFFPDESDDALQMNQDNAVIIRRNVYPQPDVKTDTPSVFCAGKSGCDTAKRASSKYRSYRKGLKQQADLKCYPDTFAGLSQFFVEHPEFAKEVNTVKYTVFHISVDKPTDAIYVTDYAPLTRQINFEEFFSHDPRNFLQKWHDALSTGIIKFYWNVGGQPPISDANEWVYMAADKEQTTPLITKKIDINFPNLIEFQLTKCLEDLVLKNSLNICLEDKKHAVANKVANTFFV